MLQKEQELNEHKYNIKSELNQNILQLKSQNSYLEGQIEKQKENY